MKKIKGLKKENVLNAYRIMWIFVFFDLPTNTKPERRSAQKFRKSLLKNGFTMMQYSVYTRFCTNRALMNKHLKRVQDLLPDKGLIEILVVTDKQYGRILTMHGAEKQDRNPRTRQLEIF